MQENKDRGDGLRDMAVPDLLKLGNALLAEGKLDMARLHFLAAIGREAQNALPYVGLGDIDFRKGNYPAAMVSYQRAIDLDPQNLAALMGQIQILREQGNLNAAQTQLNRAMQLAPDDLRVITELAIIYNMQGQDTLAAPLFQELAVKAPDASATYNNIGINELSRGNYAFAIVNLSKAYMLDGRNETAANNLAMAFTLYGQEDQALRLYTKTVGESAAWNNIGYLYMTKKRYDDAERAFRKALDINPRYYVKAKENLDQLMLLRQAEQ